jgi:hypothetical protein
VHKTALLDAPPRTLHVLQYKLHHTSQGEYGYITYRRSVSKTSDEVNPNALISTWLSDKTSASQLLFARESQVGCGRSVDDSANIEYVACFFDKVV